MVIGTRVLTLRTETGEVPVPVTIFGPEEGKDGGWFCRYEIGWPDEPWASAGWGVDAFQAVHLTMQKIAIELYTSDEHREGRLFWQRQEGGYGFPITKNGRELLVGFDKQYDG